MALRKFLILRKPRSGCLEGRTALIQLIDNSFTGSHHEGVLLMALRNMPHPEVPRPFETPRAAAPQDKARPRSARDILPADGVLPRRRGSPARRFGLEPPGAQRGERWTR